MTDRFQDPDGELLSAWLAGDLDDPAAAAVERRLEVDPALGARLDVLSETVGRLQGLGEIELPHATADRLRERLATERSRGTPPAWLAPADRPAASPPHQATAPAPEARHGPGRPGVGTGAPAPGSPRPAGPGRPGVGTGAPAPGSPAPAGPGRPPRDTASRGARRRRRRTAVAGVAAVALVAVVGLGALLPVLRGGGAAGGRGADSAEMAQQEAGEEGAAAAGSASEFALQDGEQEAAAPGLASGPPLLAGPVVVDAGAALDVNAARPEQTQEPAADEDTPSSTLQAALRSRFLGRPETEALLGRSVQEARALGDAAIAVLEAEPALPSIGTPPSVCLAAVLGDDDAAVPVRVERFALNGQDVLAYVTVRAGPGSEVLDRTEVAVVDPGTCDVVAAVS